MKPERINQVIAEYCGWFKAETEVLETRWPGGRKFYTAIRWFDKSCKGSPALFGGRTDAELPDYYHDLNAMHEAEGVLLNSGKVGCWTAYVDLLWNCGNAVHTTAAQRAEAFLRTLGLWEES